MTFITLSTRKPSYTTSYLIANQRGNRGDASSIILRPLPKPHGLNPTCFISNFKDEKLNRVAIGSQAYIFLCFLCILFQVECLIIISDVTFVFLFYLTTCYSSAFILTNEVEVRLFVLSIRALMTVGRKVGVSPIIGER